MARQIVEELRFIHTNQFVHRDLATKFIFVGAFQDEKEIKIEDFGISEQFKFECESNLINLSFYCSKLIVYFLLIFFWQRYFVRKVKKFKLTLKETKVKRLLREKDPSMQKQIYTVCELLCSCCCTLTISGTERKQNLDKLKSIEFPNDWENERYKPLKSLISDMMSVNPDDCPSAEEVLP